MKDPKVPLTIRLDPGDLARLEQLSTTDGRPVADLVRTAVSSFLKAGHNLSASELRHHRICEYMQIAIDWIIQQDHPTVRDHLIAQTDLRMERHHGA